MNLYVRKYTSRIYHLRIHRYEEGDSKMLCGASFITDQLASMTYTRLPEYCRLCKLCEKRGAKKGFSDMTIGAGETGCKATMPIPAPVAAQDASELHARNIGMIDNTEAVNAEKRLDNALRGRV